MKRMNPQRGLISIGKSRAKVYVENETGVTFDDIAGIDEARAELMEIVDFLKNPERYRRLGGKIPKGVLLVGASGTGKTQLAQAAPRRARRLRHPGRGDHPRGHQPAGDPRSRPAASRALPSTSRRETILRVHRRAVTLAPDLDLSLFAARTPGFVGADLAHLVNEAALHAAREGKEAVDLADFDRRPSRGRSRSRGGIPRTRRQGIEDLDSSRVGWPRSGITQQQPTEDRYPMTRAALLARLDVLLGGRVAEERLSSPELRRAGSVPSLIGKRPGGRASRRPP